MRLRLFIIFAALLLQPSAWALVVTGGDISSGGGDALVMAFTMAGQKACVYLKNIERLQSASINSADFCSAVEQVKVASEEVTILNGVEVDAINMPSLKTIVLSQARNKGKSISELKSLAVHEYLSVLGLDDSTYRYSGPIADQISKEIDYFPVRDCEVEQKVQIGSLNSSRLAERSYLIVTYKTDFPDNQPANIWFDFGKDIPFVRDAETGVKIQIDKIIEQLKDQTVQICRGLRDQTGQAAGELCFKAEGRRDLIKDYLAASSHHKTMVRLGLSKFRNLSTVEFVSTGDSNPFPHFSNVSGYVDKMGFQGTKQLYTKQIFNNDPDQVSTTSLKTWGAEFFKVLCK